MCEIQLIFNYPHNIFFRNSLIYERLIIFNWFYQSLRFYQSLLILENLSSQKYSDIEDTLNIIVSLLLEENMRIRFRFLNIFSTLAVFFKQRFHKNNAVRDTIR